MTKKGGCELCGMPDDSYTIEDDGKVFHVCKLCHDGFIEKHGDLLPEDPLSDIVVDKEDIDKESEGSKVHTLSAEQLAKILTPGANERKKIYAAMRKKNREEGRDGLTRYKDNNVDDDDSADIEESAVETEKTKEDLPVNKNYNPDLLADSVGKVMAVDADEDAFKVLLGQKHMGGESDKNNKSNKKLRADAKEKRAAYREQLHRDVNRHSDDERIKITSPEVELKTDRRYKTNLEVATAESETSVRFIDAFKYVINPVIYAIFAGAIVLATATGKFIVDWQGAGNWWLSSLVILLGGAAACTAGFFLILALKHAVATDRRTWLLKIRQEQILFASVKTDCYRELRTKFPELRALAWFCDKLAYIMPVAAIIGGTVAGVILTFLYYWWLLPVAVVGSVIVAMFLYFLFKLFSNALYYKLEIERNQQIQQQTLLDLLDKLKK